MVGGEGEGSVSVNENGNANATSAGVHPPATAAAVVAKGGSGNGNAGKGSGGGLVVEKVKFTVSVRGHQWSSARHVNETLEEFAAAIERNARHLAFIDNDDSIQRLQLAYSDGSEPEDLDVDATLGDVIICMCDKQLLAIVNSKQTTPPPPLPGNRTPTQRPDTEYTGQITSAKVSHCNHCNVNVAAPSSSPDLRSTVTTEPNTLPESPSLHFQTVERACSLHPDYVEGTGASLPPLPICSGKRSMGGVGKPASRPSAVQQQFCCNPTPSPAELANMLVQSSSHCIPGPGALGVSGATSVSASTNTHSPAAPTPTAGFQSFASALLSRLPMLPNQNIQCAHGATTSTALLAQFLALQLLAFSTPGAELPTHVSCGDHKAPQVANPIVNPVSNASPACNLQAGKENRPDPGVQANNPGSPNHPDGAHSPKLHVSGVTSLEKSKEKSSPSSYSSANVHDSVAPPSEDNGGVANELPAGGSELMFLVKRRSKTRPHGVGTYHLRLSDLSTHFHLNLVNAAKKLGVSQTTLKKACREFRLPRWPGRKVRGLKNTIDGLQHTLALGRGAGLEEVTEANLRSDVDQLTQEMDQIFHGTPAQVTQKMHSAAASSAYKYLYSHGWRSRSYSAGRYDMITLDTGHPTNPRKRASGLAPLTGGKYRKAAKVNQQRERETPRKAIAASKENSVVTPPSGKGRPPYTVMKDFDIEGLLPEIHDIHLGGNEDPTPETPLMAENGDHNCGSPGETRSEKEQEVVFVEGCTIGERSPKRPKCE